jgi:prepilin-type processing-associated H-X9-DG protein
MSVGQADLVEGDLDNDDTPKVLRCPADIGPDSGWDGAYPGVFGRRTYAMDCVGPGYLTEIQVNPELGEYPLPPVDRGVGIYWEGGVNKPDWNARGYPTSVLEDPAGTLLLVELPGGNNVAGNVWPSVSLGPYSTAGAGTGDLYQIATNDSLNQGAALYASHGQRFNYLFHDNHVATLQTQQTIGTGTLAEPKGMWTIAPGD